MIGYERVAATNGTGLGVGRAVSRLLGSLVDPETGCWEWQHCTTVGYGRIKLDGKVALAHRVSYELFVGPIPAGLHLDHLCRNRKCVNPAHLEPVTRRENILRGTGWAARNAVKTHCLRGHDLSDARVSLAGGRCCRACERLRRNAARAASVHAVAEVAA